MKIIEKLQFRIVLENDQVVDRCREVKPNDERSDEAMKRVTLIHFESDRGTYFCSRSGLMQFKDGILLIANESIVGLVSDSH